MRASLKADIEKLFAIYMEIEGPSAKRPLTSEIKWFVGYILASNGKISDGEAESPCPTTWCSPAIPAPAKQQWPGDCTYLQKDRPVVQGHLCGGGPFRPGGGLSQTDGALHFLADHYANLTCWRAVSQSGIRSAKNTANCAWIMLQSCRLPVHFFVISTMARYSIFSRLLSV